MADRVMKQTRTSNDLRSRFEALGPWYHRIEFASGVYSPGDRNQALVYALYEPHLPHDLSGWKVLDLGANACGLSIEFAKRGAHVTAVEYSTTYTRQAEFVIEYFGLAERIELLRKDVFSSIDLGKFDIVAYVGLAYHLRYPQLCLDMIARLCTKKLLCSTQTIPGNELMMRNRAATHRKHDVKGQLYGWEPTEELFVEMLAHAGFQNSVLVSRAPHKGERRGNRCGNTAYFYAEAALRPPKLPFLDADAYTKAI